MPFDLILFLALPFGFLGAAIEGLVIQFHRKRQYNWRGYLVSLVDSSIRQYIINPFLSFSIAFPLLSWAWEHRLYTIPMPSALSFLALLVGQDFCHYWMHRCQHKVRWLWVSMHVVHHTPNEMNLSIAYRLGWTARLFGAIAFYTPLILVGFPVPAVFASIGAALTYMYVLHNEWIGDLRWFGWIFNTPSHHRVHHAVNPEYLDANFGSVLIIFDRLFGTFVKERPDLPCRYGLVNPVSSNNFFEIEFREWPLLARDLWHAKSWRERLMYLFAPPGWQPEGRGCTTEDLRRAAAE
jgi:sterol desaturase/sphingolipid hydroxylase (fatty acid hydroxylase superfamily)